MHIFISELIVILSINWHQNDGHAIQKNNKFINLKTEEKKWISQKSSTWPTGIKQ